MWKSGRLVVIAGLLACCGCLSQQVAKDSRGLRQAMIDLYTDQAIDNLIRAHESLPFVQLTYNQLSINDTDKYIFGLSSGNAAFGRTKTRDLTQAAPLNSIQKMTSFAGSFPFGGSAERDRLLTFHAKPVTTHNWVYEEYLDFARNPMLFVTSPEKPTCPVHICRKYCDKWYWVPVESGEAFLDLVLKTATSPDSSSAPQIVGYWEPAVKKIDVTEMDINKLAEITNEEKPGTQKERAKKEAEKEATGDEKETETPDESETTEKAGLTNDSDETEKLTYYKYEFTLAKEVPNDRGSLQVIRANGCKDWICVVRKSGNDANQLTTTELLAISSKKLSGLEGATVRFFSENHPNLTPKPSAAPSAQSGLENIRIQLNKIQSNGF